MAFVANLLHLKPALRAGVFNTVATCVDRRARLWTERRPYQNRSDPAGRLPRVNESPPV